jgi:hypothetical protein
MLTHGDDCSIIMADPTHGIIKNFIDKCINSVNACKEFAAHSAIENESRVRQNRFELKPEDLYDESIENNRDGGGDYEPESESEDEDEDEDEDEEKEKKSKKDNKRKRKDEDEDEDEDEEKEKKSKKDNKRKIKEKNANLIEPPPKKTTSISSNDDHIANSSHSNTQQTTTTTILSQDNNDEPEHSNNATDASDIMSTTEHESKKITVEMTSSNNSNKTENILMDLSYNNKERNQINLPRAYGNEQKIIMELKHDVSLFKEDNFIASAETFQRIIQNEWLEGSLVDYCIRDTLNTFHQKNKINIDNSLHHVCSHLTYKDHQETSNFEDNNEIDKKKYVYIPIFDDDHFWLVCIVNYQNKIRAIVFDSLYTKRKKFYGDNKKSEFQSKIMR